MKNIKNLKSKLLLTVIFAVFLVLFWILKLPCVYKHFLNIECIGCGMTRACVSALKLDFKTAFSYHPMFWSMPVLYLYFLFDGKLFGKKYLDGGILVLITLGFFINWLLKVLF